MSFVELTGAAKLDRMTKNLVKRLSADDIAIIDHRDIDRVSAEELVESGVRVVVNVAPSQTGRFPNPGPLMLVRSGVRLIDVDGAGQNLFDTVSEGELLSVRGAGLYRNGTQLVSGHVLGERELERTLAEQRSRVTEALEAFAENTMQYLREEGKLLAEGIDFPHLAFATVTPSSSRAAPATREISASSGRTCGTSNRCSLPSTAGPTPCWRRVTRRT